MEASARAGGWRWLAALALSLALAAGEAVPFPEQAPLRVLEGHAARVRALALAGGRLYSASDDGTVRAWSASDLSPAGVLETGTRGVWDVASDQERLFTTSLEGSVRAWSVRDLSPLAVLKTPSRYALALALDGERLYASSDDGRVYAWWLENLTLAGVLVGHTEWVDDVAAYGGAVYTSSLKERRVLAWDARTLARAGEGEPQSPMGFLVLHADGERLYAEGRRPAARSYTLQAWRRDGLSPSGEVSGHTGIVSGICSDADHVYTSSRDGTARVWNRTDISLVAVLRGRAEGLSSVAADEAHVYAGSWDGTVLVWARPRPTSGEERAPSEGTAAAQPGPPAEPALPSEPRASPEPSPDAPLLRRGGGAANASMDEDVLAIARSGLSGPDKSPEASLPPSAMAGGGLGSVTAPPDSLEDTRTAALKKELAEQAERERLTEADHVQYKFTDGDKDWAKDMEPVGPSNLQLIVGAGVVVLSFGGCVVGYFKYCRGG